MPTGCLRCSQYTDTKTDAVQYIAFMHTRPDSTRVRQIAYIGSSRQPRPGWKTVGVSGGRWGWKVIDPPIVDEVWRRKRRRRRACSIIIHKGHGVTAEESDQYECKEWRKDNWQTIVSACVYTHITHTHCCVSKYVRWNISFCTVLLRYTSTGRYVCHIKVIWHGVNCIQTPDSVWDYSSSPQLPGSLPKPIQDPSICENADLGTVGNEGPLSIFKITQNTAQVFSKNYLEKQKGILHPHCLVLHKREVNEQGIETLPCCTVCHLEPKFAQW